MFPADLRLRSMEVIPKPCDGFVVFGVMAADTMVRRLAPFGEGGCGVFEGDVSLMSVLTWMWDCDEFLGLPRKKELKIVVLVGGDSFPACKWPSIRAPSSLSTMKREFEIVVESKSAKPVSRDSCQGPKRFETPCPPTQLHWLSTLRLIFLSICNIIFTNDHYRQAFIGHLHCETQPQVHLL